MASTRTFSLLPEPIWFFVDQTGLPLGSGKMYTYSSLNPTQLKPVYQDPNGTLAWPDPVNINLNGTSGPFYWLFDSSTPNDLYNVFVYDVDGNLIWQVNNFSGGAGGGGGGTTVVNVQNQIVNNTFWNNIGTSATPLPATLTVAPGTHDGFVSGTNTGGYTGPDITFVKNNTANTDQIIFTPFTLGSTPLSPDTTPLYYLKYTCGTALGESYKYVQFPVSTQNQNLSNTATTITIWARCNSGNNQLQLSWRQFFGDGGGSPDIVTPISTISLSSAWTKYVVSFNTPNPAGNTPGNCGNGGTFLLVNYPLGAVTNIDFVKPSLYLGTAAPAAEFQVPDTIDAVVNTPRTGDVRTSVNTFAPYGWLAMDDRTIGSATSGATNRANIDTFPLFSTLWNNVAAAYIPIYDAAGVLTTRGATAVADFGANKRLSLTKALGRVFAGVITPPVSTTYTTNFAVNNQLTMASTTSYPTAAPVSLSVSVGGATPSPLNNSTTYYVINLTATTIALANTPEDAIAGTQITLTGNGSGTQTITVAANSLGQFLGEVKHTQTAAEVGVHTHPTLSNVHTLGISAAAGGSSVLEIGGGSVAVVADANSGGTPFNVMQPTTFMNFFIKL